MINSKLSEYGIITIIALSSPATAQTEPPEPDDIVVTGIRYPSPRIYMDFLPGRITYDLNQKPIFAGDDGQPVTSQHACTRVNGKRETGKDRLSRTFENILSQQSDANSREYGTLLIMNSSIPNEPSFRFTSISRGETWNEAYAAGRDAPQTNLTIGSLAQFEYVVGVIHSHPSVGSPDPIRDRWPSDNDWTVYSQLQANVPSNKLAPPYAFSHYIIGPDGKVREYRQDSGKPNSYTSGINNGC